MRTSRLPYFWLRMFFKFLIFTYLVINNFRVLFIINFSNEVNFNVFFLLEHLIPSRYIKLRLFFHWLNSPKIQVESLFIFTSLISFGCECSKELSDSINGPISFLFHFLYSSTMIDINRCTKRKQLLLININIKSNHVFGLIVGEFMLIVEVF